MSNLSNSDLTDDLDQQVVKISGDTDETRIGNVGDRLKVDSATLIDPQYFNIDDMNVANGGIARGSKLPAAWTDLYSYTGSGVFYSFMVNYEGDDAKYHTRLFVDGLYYPFFGVNGITSDELKNKNLYDVRDLDPGNVCGLGMHDSAIRWIPRYPMKITTSFKIQAYHTDGSKKFRAGFVMISKV